MSFLVLIERSAWVRAAQRAVLAAAALALAPGALASADQLVTSDNRVIEVQRAREEGDAYRLTFASGEIVCPKEFVQSVVIEGDMSDYEPADEDERQKLDRGYVRYHGKWMSKAAYQSLLDKGAAASRKRTAELAVHADFSNAWQKDTKHFRVRTNTSPELLDYYAELLEAYYGLMDKRIGIKPTPTLRRTKMTVNVHKSHDDFRAANPDAKPWVLGYFWRTDHSLNFFHDYREPARSDWIALHECTHLLTYLIDQDYLPQIWLNEAVADLYGSAATSRDRRGRMLIEPGKLQTDRVLTVQQAIRSRSDLHVEHLVRVDRDNFGLFEYAHAWSFVYFLHSDERYRKGFERFFKDVYTLRLKGVEPIEQGSDDRTGIRYRYSPEQIRDHLLVQLDVDDVDQLDADWKAFVLAIELDTPTALAKRAFRVARDGVGNVEAARRDIDEALAGGLAEARAWWTRGKLALLGEEIDPRAAIRDLSESVRRDPLNAGYRVDLAFALTSSTGYATEASAPLHTRRDQLDEALRQFGLAAELEPKNDLYRQLFADFAKQRGR